MIENKKSDSEGTPHPEWTATELREMIESNYSDLLTIARAVMKGQTGLALLEPQDLVHRLWDKIQGKNLEKWENKKAFLGYCRIAIKNLLLDEIHRGDCKKRCGKQKRVPMDLCLDFLEGKGGRNA